MFQGYVGKFLVKALEFPEFFSYSSATQREIQRFQRHVELVVRDP